jgi:multidrug resistance efflux pump
MTKDQLISQNSQLLADNAEQRAHITALQAEVSRKEQVINHYAMQLKQARRKLESTSERAPSERRLAMEAAKAEAMASGRCVTV